MYRNFFKRLTDIALALILLPILLPGLIFISLIVLLSSGRPVLFRQLRAGRNGRPFNILKFRTMSTDRQAEKNAFEPGCDKRVTWAGKILRKTKLDETPQIFNVLLGHMSVVGPRPEVARYVELYPERWTRILSVRPGVTDRASILFRNEEEELRSSNDPEKHYREVILPRKMDIYEDYVSSLSFLKDVKIVFATIFAVLKQAH